MDNTANALNLVTLALNEREQTGEIRYIAGSDNPPFVLTHHGFTPDTLMMIVDEDDCAMYEDEFADWMRNEATALLVAAFAEKGLKAVESVDGDPDLEIGFNVVPFAGDELTTLGTGAAFKLV